MMIIFVVCNSFYRQDETQYMVLTLARAWIINKKGVKKWHEKQESA